MHEGTIRTNHSWYWWAAREERWGEEIEFDLDSYETIETLNFGEVPIADWVCVADWGGGRYGFHLKHEAPPFDVHLNRPLDSRSDFWVTEHSIVLLHDRWLSRLRELSPETEFKIGKVLHDGVEQTGWRNVRAGREPLVLSTNGHEVGHCLACGRPYPMRAPRGKLYLYSDEPYDDPVMIGDLRINVRADLVEAADIPDPKNSWPRSLIPLYVKA